VLRTLLLIFGITLSIVGLLWSTGDSVMAGVLAFNVTTFLGFAVDKFKAVHGLRRVPNATLLSMALLGPIGASLGRAAFRHKTRQFRYRVAISVGLALMLLAIALVSGDAP
jgi:uncharacterized membrane protein YsdA (DUF1294 family)